MVLKTEIVEIGNDVAPAPTPTPTRTTAASQTQIIEIEDDAAPTPTRNTAASTASAANTSHAPAVVPSSAARPAPPTAAAAARPNTPRSLFDLPEYAERYQPIFSTLEDVVYRDPHKFCIKPPYWERWTTEDYREFAHQLQLVDLRPIARKLNKPVEEVLYMYDGLVVGPLQDARKANDRGAQTMQSWFKLYKESGTPTRSWTDREVEGELEDITCRTIHLILETGCKGMIKLEDLNKEDHVWIHKNITLENRRVLSGMADGKEVKYETEDGLPPYNPPHSSKRKASPDLATPQPQKKRRLSVEPATAPAKMLATPSAPMSVPTASTTVQQDATPSKAPVSARTPRPARSQTQTAATQIAKPTTDRIPFDSPPSLRIYRSWTSAKVMAGLRAIAPAAVVLEERESKSEISISLCALSREDKDWLVDAKKRREIDSAAWAALKSTSTTADAFRLWTAREILARAEGLSHQSVRLLLLNDRSTVEVGLEDLSEEDKEYLQRHFPEIDVNALYEAAVETVVVDDGADDENEPPIDDGEAQDRFTSGLSEEPAASPRPVHSSADRPRRSATPAPFEDPEEAITGAPVRQWSDACFPANLVGISEHAVWLRVEEDGCMRKLPMAEWTKADYAWVKDYLVSEQRNIILGTDRK